MKYVEPDLADRLIESVDNLDPTNTHVVRIRADDETATYLVVIDARVYVIKTEMSDDEPIISTRCVYAE